MQREKGMGMGGCDRSRSAIAWKNVRRESKMGEEVRDGMREYREKR